MHVSNYFKALYELVHFFELLEKEDINTLLTYDEVMDFFEIRFLVPTETLLGKLTREETSSVLKNWKGTLLFYFTGLLEVFVKELTRHFTENTHQKSRCQTLRNLPPRRSRITSIKYRLLNLLDQFKDHLEQCPPPSTISKELPRSTQSKTRGAIRQDVSF